MDSTQSVPDPPPPPPPPPLAAAARQEEAREEGGEEGDPELQQTLGAAGPSAMETSSLAAETSGPTPPPADAVRRSGRGIAAVDYAQMEGGHVTMSDSSEGEGDQTVPSN